MLSNKHVFIYYNYIHLLLFPLVSIHLLFT